MSSPKVIAFYLPQYHPTPHNDEWWGKGFTEWTNVGKARPLFKGHYQPKVPADLGYYDLRLPEARNAQAELAKEAGIYGFCYYHYWFGNGKEELELPFNEVLRLGEPDFPFMLCWANESWHKKFWDKDGNGTSKQILVEQTYPGEQDIIDHFYRLLPAFKDHRYIRIDGKPAFMIYKPQDIPNVNLFINKWNELAIKNNLTGIFFIAHHASTAKHEMSDECIRQLLTDGFSAINIVRLFRSVSLRSFSERVKTKLKNILLRRPLTYPYRKVTKLCTSDIDRNEEIFPTLIPNWDHTPRSGYGGMVYTGATPRLFRIHCEEIFSEVNKKKDEHKVVFLKSWNEWGEGNYIEPDLKYGRQFMHALRDALKKFTD